MATDFNARLQALLSTLEHWRSDTETTTDADTEDQTPPVQIGEIVEFLLQASFLWTKSGLRFWRRGTGVFAIHLLEMLRTVPALTADPIRRGEAQGTLIDILRTYFREMAELPGHESRRFLAELEKIERNIGAPFQEVSREPAPRRWQVKP
jgi:hypothetical protein